MLCYNGDAFSTQYGYRIIDVKEGDSFGSTTVFNVVFQGFFRKLGKDIARVFTELVTGRQVTYAD